jgi:hypothetical protein
VGFGSTFRVMSSESVVYNEASFATATQLISNMTADLGKLNEK